MTRLTGEFVALRPLISDDAELTLGWRQSRRARFLNTGAQTVADQATWIVHRPDSERNFIIELAGGRPVGMLSLIDIDLVNRRAETSRFLIGDEDAVRGVPAAVEAMKLLYEYAFGELGLIRLYGTVADGNRRMVQWQKYLGMQEEGRLRRHYLLDGEWHDAVCLGLLEHEYLEISLPRMNALIGAARPSAERSAS
ncbi:MAG: GNAT family N-acetyltransferase [Solirubrobacteraceae bacterium]